MEHPEDHELLLAAELEECTSEPHLRACARCRARQAELLAALDEASEAQRDTELPPIDGARDLLHTELRDRHSGRWRFAAAGAAAATILLAIWLPLGAPFVGAPQAALTPGAVRPVGRETLCAVGAGMDRAGISHAVAAEVFRRYGIHNPARGQYEVDYLIPPDLGGSDDPRNLWPQAYNEGKWNSRVKDALEDRLRTMVCDGTLDLKAAQEQIAGDWVAAYQKHFRSGEPLPDHVAFVRDRPWE